ncbi:MAG: ribonuclease J [Myxococcota bacterium]
MNLNMYAWKGALMMVDCGITFERAPGGETTILMPDPTWAVRRREKLAGLVLTHAHEDHIGAVAALWPRLRCPVIATPFTAAVLNAKFSKAGIQSAVPMKIVPAGGRTTVGPFKLRFINITHSTAESQCVVIETDHGRILHTGDWKLDPAPLVGPKTDTAALKALGQDGVIAAVSDSTNATKSGRSGSERDVREHLQSLVANRPGRVIVACFASNIARIQTMCEVARATDRHPVLLGRSLHRMTRAARATGYLSDGYGFVPIEHAGYLPREKILLICTGTQGEPLAAMSRLATDSHRHVMLDPGDVAVFSSKIIPGNELPIAWLHKRLGELGVDVISEKQDERIHVSGHPCQDELRDMYTWTNPRLVVPVHGTPRHMAAHAALSREMGIPALEVTNGAVVRLAPGEPAIIDQVQAGRVRRPDVEKNEHLIGLDLDAILDQSA